MPIRTLLSVLAIVAVAGCVAGDRVATMPVPMSPQTGHGYVESPIDGDRYTVTYRTRWLPTAHHGAGRVENAEEIRDLARDMALWRASLLALETGHESFDAEAGPVDLTAEIERYPGFVHSLLLSPGREPFDGRFGSPTFWDYYDWQRFPHVGRGVARMRGEANLRVTLRADGSGAYDAAAVADSLGERYGGGGTGAARAL